MNIEKFIVCPLLVMLLTLTGEDTLQVNLR